MASSYLDLFVATASVAIAVLIGLLARANAIARGKAPRDAATLALDIAISASPMFPLGAIQDALRDLRRHWSLPSGEIDISRSIAATVRSGGLAQFRMGDRSVTPDYILLSDRVSRRDHFGEFGEILVSRLRLEKVAMTRAEYFGDPRRLSLIAGENEREAIELHRLAERHPDARLLLFADIADLWDPLREQWRDWVRALHAFASVAILTPTTREQWGSRARELIEDGFLVVQATSKGVADLAHQFRVDLGIGAQTERSDVSSRLEELLDEADYCWSDEASPSPNFIEELIQALRVALEPGAYLHLCAIAVFPAINPRLTEQVGLELRDLGAMNDFDESSYVAMLRLPWLRRSRMPDWIRTALLESLPPSDATMLRALWSNLLLEEPTSANRLVSLDLVDSRRLNSRLKELLRRFRSKRGLALAERVMLRFLAGKHFRHLTVPAPKRAARRRQPAGIMLPDLRDLLLSLVDVVAGYVLRQTRYWKNRISEFRPRPGVRAAIASLLMIPLTVDYEIDKFLVSPAPLLVPLAFYLIGSRERTGLFLAVALASLPLVAGITLGAGRAGLPDLHFHFGKNIGLYLILLMILGIDVRRSLRRQIIAEDVALIFIILLLGILFGSSYAYDRNFGVLAFRHFDLGPPTIVAFVLIGSRRSSFPGALLVFGMFFLRVLADPPQGQADLDPMYDLWMSFLSVLLPAMALLAGRSIRRGKSGSILLPGGLAMIFSSWSIFPVCLAVGMGRTNHLPLMRILLPILTAASLALRIFLPQMLSPGAIPLADDFNQIIPTLIIAASAWLTAEILGR